MSDKKPDLFMVFDVESIGLHGEGFAVGYVVVDRLGKEIGSARFSCDPQLAAGTDEARAWVAEHIPSLTVTHHSPVELRNEFWISWMAWKAKGATLFADCLWPVEARFLAQCVADSPITREWEGPYPFHEIATVLLVSGKSPTSKFSRKADELPDHDPLADARQSARILIENFNRGDGVICPKCSSYLPGHATGAGDICNCES